MDMLNRLKSAVTSVIPGNPLSRDFDIQGQVASTGPGLLWKVFTAVKKSTKEEASVFYFDKKSIEKHSKKDREVIIETLKRGVQQLTRLRHPKILSVIHPLEETREALAFATEPVFASLANVLGACDNIGGPSKFLSDFQLYEVEIKHGLLQVLEGLGFLHNDAKMIHRNICPTSIILAKSGTWKLAGCEFVQQVVESQDQKQAYQCIEWRNDTPWEAQPNLDFMAPEYELTHDCSPASDMFSFGILMFSLYNKGKPLYECRGELRVFRQNVQEVYHVKLLLNIEPTLRPETAQMMRIPFFEDMACIALQYIDSLYQRENMEKSNFFKGLPKVIEHLPKRVSQQRILPALFKEGINNNMVPFILPSIFMISEQSTKEEYQALVLPELIPFFKIREPVQVMLMFLQNMSLLLSKTPAQQIQTYVFPLIFSALESDSPQIQELCLSIIPTFADLIEYTTLKKSLIPRIKKLCLGTSVLTVRVNCLLCIGKLMDQMDKWFVLDEILPFLREIPSREPAVLMSILGIHKVALSEAKLGITKDVMANKVLPFLIPLSIDNNLNLSQFLAYMGVIKEMLGKVETEHRTKLEQLEQIQHEHKTLEISKITGENGTLGKQVEGKYLMDKFLVSFGLGGMSPHAGSGDTAKTVSSPASAVASPNNDASEFVTPKKTSLSLEEKQRLAKQKEQERMLKSQKSLVPQNQVSSPVQSKTSPSSSGPRDLTSTLMESNMRNLSMSSKASPMTGVGSVQSGMTLSGGMNTMPSAGVTWQGGNTMAASSTVNWAAAASPQSSQYMSSQSLGSSPSQPLGGKPVDLSSFDSLLPASSSKKTPLNQLGQSPGPRPGMQSNLQQPIASNTHSNMMGVGGIQGGQNVAWGGGSGFSSPSISSFPQQSAVGGYMNPQTSGSWGGQPVGGIGPGHAGMVTGGFGSSPGIMQPMKPSAQNSGVKNNSLTSDDLKDLLG
ncbi:unnamed protein product [Candidula unifasciata]|uniref:Protein kinase domain-containing protein n=1 Tax=Candidula unifasciata TaxID=100452 RepID=A0A8S3ZZ57_9EUPU|nr:unnamed protein product [Candidula unifasciata]